MEEIQAQKKAEEKEQDFNAKITKLDAKEERRVFFIVGKESNKCPDFLS